MNMHRAEVADWANIEYSNLTRLQKIAKWSGGIITLGNIITLVGAGITTSGIIDIHEGKTKKGTFKLGVGRFCDVADGYVAHRTGTKSPKGESLDATIDKVLSIAMIRVAYKREIISKITYRHILGQNLANAVLVSACKLTGSEIHPSISGKHAMAAQGMVVGLNSLAMAYEEGGDFERAANTRAAALVFEAAAIYKGAKATGGYIQDLVG